VKISKPPELPISLRNQLRGSTHPVSLAIRFRSTLPLPHVTALASILPNLASREPGVLAVRYPPHFSQLSTRGRFPSVSCEREIAWALGSLLREAAHIQTFLDKKYEFDRALFCANWQKCHRLLDEIEQSFGVSMIYRQPREIVGLTAFNEVLREHVQSLRKIFGLFCITTQAQRCGLNS
jgi:hypothetical protein